MNPSRNITRQLLHIPLRANLRRFSNISSGNSINFTQLPVQNIESTGCSLIVTQLVDSIEKLNLLEIAALARLNIPDFQPSANFSSATSSTQPTTQLPNEVASTPEVPPQQTEFKIILQKVDPAAKAKVIREIKATLPGLNLVEARTFVESAPKLVKEKLNSADAEKLKKTLEDLGAIVSME